MTILQQDGPNHLGLWYNALPEHQMALITSGSVPFRSPRTFRPVTEPTGMCIESRVGWWRALLVGAGLALVWHWR